MKRIFLFFLLIVTSCFAQKSKQNFITIEGELKGFKDDDKISVFDQYNLITLASTYIKDGKFIFDKIKVEDATEFSISIKEDNEWYFINPFFSNINTTIQIIGNNKELDNVKIINSKLYKFYNEYKNLTTRENKKLDSIYKEVDDIKKQGKWDTIIRKKYKGPNGILDKIDSLILSKQKDYFIKNSNSIFTLKHLLRYYISNFNNSEINYFYLSLTNENKKSKYGKLIQTYIKNKQLSTGDSFYEIAGEDENGKNHKISEIIKNKYTLISFTSAYCPHSVDSIKDLLKLEKNFQEKLQIVTYYIDMEKSEWINFNKEKKINWLFLWDRDMRFSEAVAKYHITGTPTFYLFDKNGKMIKLFDGYDEAIFYKDVAQFLQ